MNSFEPINKGFNQVFRYGKLSVGVVVPIEQYSTGPVPAMKHHLERVQLAEQLGFKAIWVRDVPFNVPAFGDAGQTYDPFTYLGFLAAQTSEIGLGIASIALPLHHPVHVAKSVATIDQLSNGRLIMGVASGDRYEEYPGMAIEYESRGKLFRDAFEYIRAAQEDFPILEDNHFGKLNGQADILPKPSAYKIPMLLTGYSRQSLDWNAEHSDGWMYYPRDLYQQQNTIAQWRTLIAKTSTFSKPFLQPLYIDLQEDENFKPQLIHLGFRIGAKYLVEYLHHLEEIGVNHIALNLRFNTNNIEQTLEQLAAKVLPHFHKTQEAKTTS